MVAAVLRGDLVEEGPALEPASAVLRRDAGVGDDGAFAYVMHFVGAPLTKLCGLDQANPAV
jgi:hypothetical protein